MKLKEVFVPFTPSLHRQRIWIHRFLRIYWIIIILHTAAQLLAYWTLSYERTPYDFYIHVILNPNLFMGTAVLAAECVHKWAYRYSFFTLFGAGAVLSIQIIELNMDIRIITALLLLPVIASTIFFRVDLTLLSVFLQTAAFLSMYFGDPWFRTFLSPFDMIAVPLFLFVAMLVSILIIMSGRELASDLELANAEKRYILRQSKKDAQTGLYNHVTFQHIFESALHQAAHEGEVFQLALLDIDNFKRVNDHYGHLTGDAILSQVARIIRENVDPGDIAARYGGEEFALLLFNKEFHEAHALLERIRKQISETPFEELNGRSVTVSVGLKPYAPGISKEKLFEETDALLYLAKRSGKNQVAL